MNENIIQLFINNPTVGWILIVALGLFLIGIGWLLVLTFKELHIFESESPPPRVDVDTVIRFKNGDTVRIAQTIVEVEYYGGDPICIRIKDSSRGITDENIQYLDYEQIMAIYQV